MILAGGQARRMGQDKALLQLGGRTVLARTVDIVGQVCDDIQVVGRAELPPDCPPARVTEDSRPGAGPLGGVHAGMLNARHAYVLCVACDYPFLSADVLRLLAHRAAGRDMAVPLAGGVAHVTQAVYAARLLPVVEEHLQSERYRLRDLITGHDVDWVDESDLRRLDPALDCLLNVNMPEEWKQALAIARDRQA